MITTVRLPKHVAINNPRLAGVHYSVMIGTLVSLVYYKFIVGHEQYIQIPFSVQAALRWDESATIQGMETFYAYNPLIEQTCHQAPSTNYTPAMRWGFQWPVRVVCTSMCTLDSVIDHSTWDSVWRTGSTPTGKETYDGNCWTDFQKFSLARRYTALQFLKNQGDQDAILTTSKNDWIVDHIERTRSGHVEIAPQGTAGVLHIEYRYTLADNPPTFPFARQNQVQTLEGSNEHAKTVILDANQNPVRLYEPGEPIRFVVADLLSWSISNTGTPPDFFKDHLMTGGQYNMEINCFGDNIDVESHFGRGTLPRYDPTISEPVCFVEPTQISQTYQVAVHYEIPADAPNSSKEVISETMGFYIKCTNGSGKVSVWDGSALLISITSMLVMLALPKKLTSFVASRCLGPLSQMYRRSINEPYDIERATAAAATVLAANMGAFSNHSTRYADEGKNIMHMKDLKGMLTQAMAHKTDEIQEEEVASLARFVYEGIHAKERDDGWLSEFCCCSCELFPCSCKCFGAQESEPTPMTPTASLHGILLNEWNEVRMEGEKVTFEAVVKLFDKDRRRLPMEDFFTPNKIKAALARAGRPSGLSSNLPSEALAFFGLGSSASLPAAGDAKHGDQDDPCSAATSGKQQAIDQAGSAGPGSSEESSNGEPALDLSVTTSYLHKHEHVNGDPEMRSELVRITERLHAAEQRLGPLEETLSRGLFREGTDQSNGERARGRAGSIGSSSADAVEKRLEHLESRCSTSRTKLWATAIMKSLGPDADAEEEPEPNASHSRTRRRRSSPEVVAARPPAGSRRPSRPRTRGTGDAPARIAEEAAPPSNGHAPAGNTAGQSA